MAWLPTVNTLTPREIVPNLLAYIAANQVEALEWASGSEGFKPIKTFANSVANRSIPVFPSIAFSDDDDLQDFTGDGIEAVYSCTFEVSAQDANPDTATTNARIYCKMLCAVIMSCPAATLGANTGGTENLTRVQTLEVGFEQIKTNEMQNDFLQQFQIRITCSLYGLMAV